MGFDFLRLPGGLTITTEQNATILAKNTNPAAELLCSGVRLCAEAAEKPYFKRFSGIKKPTVILSKLRWTFGGEDGI